MTAVGFTNPQDHATQVAGLAVGDLMDGQDSNVSTTTARRDRSGYAGEAELYFWRSHDDLDIDTALDDIAGEPVQVLNMSIADAEDANCLGETVESVLINDLYDAGILTFDAAGNGGHSSGCTVTEPGAAIGSFVVGSHTTDEATEGEDEVRDGAISSFSARGGTSLSDGKHRSIIDITAPGCRELMFSPSGGYGESGCATSWAAPTATGMAASFIDFYKETFSSAIDAPGSLHANMLLMGDRQGESDNCMNSYFDNVWGAGRLKMRQYNGEGMDSPWAYGSLQTCIDDDETYHYSLNGGDPISIEVEPIKAVAFWFDRNHEDGDVFNDIDLRLQRNDGSGWETVSTSADPWDEKERVVHSNVASSLYEWRLRFYGWDVEADAGSSCGTDSQRVRFAYFYEDSARDDANGPGSETDPECF